MLKGAGKFAESHILV